MHIGKESNDFELVQARLVGSEQEVLTTYEKDPWLYVQPVLVQMPTKLIVERTGYRRRMVDYFKRGEKRPSETRFPDALLAAAEFARRGLLRRTCRKFQVMTQQQLDCIGIFNKRIGLTAVS